MHAPSRRRLLSSLLAAVTAAAGFASTSCAAPRFPVAGGGLRARAGGYELEVLLDGAPAPTYHHAGETYVLGNRGARYTLRVVNHTGRRMEAVISIDGRDVIDGKPADVRKRGYLVPAWGAVDIDGWRLSNAEVAAFRFASVADSYAARTGSARDVGVIGVAVFPERSYAVRPPRPLYAPPASPPPWGGWRRDDERGYADADAAADAESRSGGAPRGSRAPLDALADKSSVADGAGRGATSSESAAAAAAPPRSPVAGGDPYGDVRRERRQRPGLGTEFGEAMTSPVQEVSFVRADASRPAAVLGARYNDRDGLLALGVDVDRCCDDDSDLAWRQSATPFPANDRRYAPPPAGWHRGCCSGY